jgi:2-dehydropantoate 2-reductase
MITPIQSVYFIGLGAIGAKYASKIYDFNPEMVNIIVNQERLKRYTEEGFFVNGKRYDFNYVTPEMTINQADLIIIAVKSYQLNQAIEDIKPFVGENTLVLSLLNGITSFDAIANEIGLQHVLYSIVYMDAVRQQNYITYKSNGIFVFGEATNTERSTKVQRIVDLFEKADIPYEVPENMILGLWRKFLINIVVNQLSFIVNGSYRIFQDNHDVMALMQIIGDEVINVANAYKVSLEQSDIDNMKKTMLVIDGAAKTSMLQDREAQRKSEIEIFAGELIRLGEKAGVATPYNQMIYHLVKGIEALYPSKLPI